MDLEIFSTIVTDTRLAHVANDYSPMWETNWAVTDSISFLY